MIHLVNAWSNDNNMVLGQVKTEEKTVIPTLLDTLELEGAIITIDAMGCQTAIAEKIVYAGGGLCVGGKGESKVFIR